MVFYVGEKYINEIEISFSAALVFCSYLAAVALSGTVNATE